MNNTKQMNLNYLGISDIDLKYNLSEDALYEITLEKGEGELNNTDALMVETGHFTGRSPKDRFIVRDNITDSEVHWGEINIPIAPEYFDRLYKKITQYLSGKTVYVRDVHACADEKYMRNVRVINEVVWQNLFARNMFIEAELPNFDSFDADWHVIAAPGFEADPAEDGTRSKNFSVINFTKKMILIGGTAYTGEIKKGVFSALNFELPKYENVLSMHCSANMGDDGDTAVFFGLSGTGKTTLSADPDRHLIGDDEHGWSDQGVFNFEGGCYAKTINLKAEHEPEIYYAINKGALVENMLFVPGTRQLDFTNKSITPNIRVSYPLSHIPDAVIPSVGGHPHNVFMLTYDAFGVLPPIAKLTDGQAMYQFISGFTSKVAGTEEGVNEPQVVFSACYGEPFLPLHPMVYADMLGKKMREHQSNVWLVNTGLVGGGHGVGHRISISYTRAMINAALSGELENQAFETMPVFGFQIPLTCPGVPSEHLNPRDEWEDKSAYDHQLNVLARAFIKNFKQYDGEITGAILDSAPVVDTSLE